MASARRSQRLQEIKRIVENKDSENTKKSTKQARERIFMLYLYLWKVNQCNEYLFVFNCFLFVCFLCHRINNKTIIVTKIVYCYLTKLN